MGKQRGRLERGVFFSMLKRVGGPYISFFSRKLHTSRFPARRRRRKKNQIKTGEEETGTLAFLSCGGIITTSPFPDSQWAPKSYLEIKSFQKRRRGGKAAAKYGKRISSCHREFWQDRLIEAGPSAASLSLFTVHVLDRHQLINSV